MHTLKSTPSEVNCHLPPPAPPPQKNEFFFTKAYLIIVSGSYLHFQLVTFRYHIIYTPARSWDFFVLKLFHSCRRGHGVWDNNVVNIKRIATFLLLQQGAEAGWWHRLSEVWGRAGSGSRGGRRRHHSGK